MGAWGREHQEETWTQ